MMPTLFTLFVVASASAPSEAAVVVEPTAAPDATAAVDVVEPTAAADEAIQEIEAAPVSEVAPPPEAEARAEAPVVTTQEKSKGLQIGGYIQPSFGMKYRPAGQPRDRWEYGVSSSAVGFGFSGEVAGGFSYKVLLVVDVGIIEAISTMGLADSDGDLQVDSAFPVTNHWSGTLLDNVTISYRPIDELTFKAGMFRIPFTNASSSANTAVLFASRPGPNQVFLSGSDQGITANVSFLDGRYVAIVGAFNGTSLGLLPNTSGNETRGLVYMGRVDANPLGALPNNEWDAEHGPLRVGAGAGLIFRPATIFDAAGYESIYTRDLRLAASARLAFRGFFLQAEFLRRQQTDSLTHRPKTANGAYLQTSYYFDVHEKLAILPIARLGYTVEDGDIEPRTTGWLEGGIAIFPQFGDGSGSPRFIVQYVGEQRISEAETAHGVVAQLQLEW